MPGPGWYLIGEEERNQVLEVLDSRELSRYRFDGTDHEVSKTMLLERAMADALGISHVLAVNSGTSALLCSLLALGVGPGDEVIVPGYTFIASIAAVLFTGASAVLAEIDESLTLCPRDAKLKVTPRTKAIVVVHMIGAPADMAAFAAIAGGHGVAIVEDVAQACGARYQDRPLGAHGRVGAFSLNVGKTLTTGDGGLVTTDDQALYMRAFAVHDHGFRPDRAGVADDGSLLGLNLRMNELGAALGLAQARRLPDVLARCRANHEAVREVFEDMPGARGRTVYDSDGECSSAHVLVFEEAERARRAAAALGGHTLAASPKHNYATMAQLQHFLDRHIAAEPRLRFGRPGELPRTDSILPRCVALAIGVVDGYLGTLGDITILDDPNGARAKACELRRAMEHA